MDIEIIIIALLWGALSGLLLLRITESLLATFFCLQGLLASRWKRLVNKASPGQIKYNVILHTLLRIVLFGVLFGVLYAVGDGFVRREFRFGYQGRGETLWMFIAACTALILLRGAWRRLVVVWRITHQYDYAEKRKRTVMLKK